MKKFCCLFLAAVLAFVCWQAACAAVEINLAAGEKYVIPESRRGTYTVDDESVVRVSGDTILALAPGRTVVHAAGAVNTDFAVLVLYSASAISGDAPADPPAEAEAPAAPKETSTVPSAAQTDESTGEIIVQLPGTAAAPAQTERQAEEPPAPSEPEEPAPEPVAEQDSVTAQAYDRSAVPDLINDAIDLAFTQWEEDAARGTKKFSRLGKYNKYSYWQCGSGAGCDIGWCGAFLGYVYDHAHVPMDVPTESVPHEGGIPYSVHAAGVGKIYTGFSKMERLSMIPRPGYFVVYGQQKGYAYKHIGLVVDVDPLDDGQYLIKTIEGNMSSTIRRYCYLYDSNEKVKNLKPCPEEYVRDDAGINAYEHVKNWNITAFCQTWVPQEE